MPIDYSKYPDNWLHEIRPAILKRAQFRCEFCKVRHKARGYRNRHGTFVDCDEFMLQWAEREGKKVIRIILTVAHLDQDVTNNDFNNLRALCQKCHLNHDRPFNKNKRSMKRSGSDQVN